MNKLCCGLVLLITLVLAMPAWSSGAITAGQMTSPQAEELVEYSTPGAGASLLAAVSNLAYFPLRFTITLVTAELGGFTGWMTGGDKAAADAVWQSTDGEAFVRPEVLEGRQRLHFGRWE